MNIMANEKIKIAFEKEKNNIVLIENNQTRKHTYLTLLDYTRGYEHEAYNIFYWLYIRGTYKNEFYKISRYIDAEVALKKMANDYNELIDDLLTVVNLDNEDETKNNRRKSKLNFGLTTLLKGKVYRLNIGKKIKSFGIKNLLNELKFDTE